MSKLRDFLSWKNKILCFSSRLLYKIIKSILLILLTTSQIFIKTKKHFIIPSPWRVHIHFSPLLLNKNISIDFSAIFVHWKLCFFHTIMWVCRNTNWLSVLCNFIMHERNHLNNSTFYRLKGEHRHYTFLTHLCQKNFFRGTIWCNNLYV